LRFGTLNIVSAMAKVAGSEKLEVIAPSSATDNEGPVAASDTASPRASNKLAEKPASRDARGTLKRPGERSAPRELLRWLARSFAVTAVLSSVVLILIGATPQFTAALNFLLHRESRFPVVIGGVWFSSIPLVLAGGAYILLQGILRPSPIELVKRLMLGGAFLLWGIVQLMPPGNLASELGNVVIALYVFDLALIIRIELHKNSPRDATTPTLVPDER
jgi:hypothetical protein